MRSTSLRRNFNSQNSLHLRQPKRDRLGLREDAPRRSRRSEFATASCRINSQARQLAQSTACLDRYHARSDTTNRWKASTAHAAVHCQRSELGGFDQHIGRRGGNFGIEPLHHAGESNGPIRIGDDAHVAGQRVSLVIDRRKLLVRPSRGGR